METENYKSLNIEDTIYTTLLTKKFENRKAWQKPNPDEVYSYIPGTIFQISVEDGQEVTEGQPILILEAMKMQNQIIAHRSGKINLNIQVGNKIPKGHLMYIIK
jgi:biotin carboxyl carrier protein